MYIINELISGSAEIRCRLSPPNWVAIKKISKVKLKLNIHFEVMLIETPYIKIQEFIQICKPIVISCFDIKDLI